MNAQKIIAVVMIVGGSVLTASVSGDIAFPAILCMLGLLGVQGRFTWDLRPQRRFITPLLLLVLAVLFALHCRYAHVRADQAAAFAWETIARYFLASMTLVLFLRPPERLPPALGLFHLATAMAAGQVLLLDDMYVAFRLSELFSVTLVVLYSSLVAGPPSRGVHERGTMSDERRVAPWVPSLALLILAVNVGWIAGSLLYRHVERFSLPGWFWRGAVTLEGATDSVAQVGFSTSGKLSSILRIKQEADLAPALTITCSGSPGYLRARAFDVYRQSQWHDVSYRDALFPEQSTPFGMYLVGRTNLFRLNEKDTAKSMTIRHESVVADALFAPLGTSAIEIPFNLLMRDDDDILYPPYARSSLSYRIAHTGLNDAAPPSSTQTRRMLNTPVQLDADIPQLASRIFAGCDTTAEKIDAVVGYFRTNYTYSLGLDVPPDQDSLTYFLLKAPTGYCEYFASGAAILLRLVGVPTRYVTGFVVTERGDVDKSWVARNMDAHAWVEAWDRERKEWTIVEATVQENLGEESFADESARKAGGGRLFLGRLLQAMYDYGPLGVLGWLFGSYGLLTGISTSVALLGAALAVFVVRRRARRARAMSDKQRTTPRERALLHKILAVMDRKVKRLGFRRDPGETLRVFAERIRRSSVVPCPATSPSDGHRFADWYLAYADLRYGRTIDVQRLEQLQQLAQALRRAR